MSSEQAQQLLDLQMVVVEGVKLALFLLGSILGALVLGSE